MDGTVVNERSTAFRRMHHGVGTPQLIGEISIFYFDDVDSYYHLLDQTFTFYVSFDFNRYKEAPSYKALNFGSGCCRNMH